MDYLFFFLGLGLLLLGANYLVDSAVAIAQRAKISNFIIGLTIVGIGTSAPELFVSIQSALTGHGDIAMGNVLGSNGSVIPLFREQIKNGGPVTVTDSHVVRYFMLIPEACKLVLEAGTKGQGGEIFVFDMGRPVKIVDLAKRMIMMSGASNVKIVFTGLRPGEKLYEEVLNSKENSKPSFNKKIRIAEVRQYDYLEVEKDIEELIRISTCYDNMATVRKMKEIVPEYRSKNSVYEELDPQCPPPIGKFRVTRKR